MKSFYCLILFTMLDKNKIIQILEKYNYWENNPKSIWYIRENYINKILSSFDNIDLIKVLIWQRRVWKSYIIKQIIHHLIIKQNINPQNILYINMEYEDFSFIKWKDELKEVFEIYKNHFKVNWKIYFFCDEIQEVETWEKYINSLRADHTLEIEIIITWSNSKLLSNELSTYLSWRYVTFDIYPFSYNDYLILNNLINSKENFLWFLNFSWIPELYNFKENKELQKNFISSLKDTIILKDLVLRYKIKDVALLEKVFLFLVNNVWNLFSINSIARKLKWENINISVTTLSNYLRYLQEILVFYWVDRYDLKWKRILEWEKKYYLNDLWFINFSFSSFDGYIWKKLENYVFTYFKQKWYNIYVWNITWKEIDFICEKDNKKIYLQVAYLLAIEDVIEREYWNLRQINDSFPKYVISLDDIKMPIDNYWIEHIRVWELCF